MHEEIHFHGHRNIQALHKSTLEVTKDEYLTLRGDCIIGVRADKACKDIDERIKEALRSSCSIRITIMVDHERWSFVAKGSNRLMLEDLRSLVIRKSDYVCARTLAIKSSAAAVDMPRRMVDLLRDGEEGVMIIEVTNIQ